MQNSDYRCKEITLEIPDRHFTAHILSPPQLSPNPMLFFTFADDWKTSLHVAPYNVAAQIFLARGHRVLSFDLPNHGARVDEFGEGIIGWRNAFIAGQNCFEIFLADAKSAVTRCIEKELATPHRIAVGGTSRAGYLALRLLAEDARIAAAAAFAPVTDWRDLSEFTADRDRKDVAALRLVKFAEALARKPIFIAIGNRDGRVNTQSCRVFCNALHRADALRGDGKMFLEFQVHDAPGHASNNAWQESGAQFLLQQLETMRSKLGVLPALT